MRGTIRHDDLVLGIDVGTSGVRIAAVDVEGREVGMASAAMPAPVRDGERIIQDPGLWWKATDAALADLATRIDLGAARALAVDGTSGTILAVDAQSRPLGRASMYNDRCSPDVAARIAALAPAGIAALGVTSPLGRALGLLPLEGGAKIVHQADWIAAQFLGWIGQTDENNALKTGYDPVVRCWPRWIDTAGLDPALLPDVVPVGTPLGTVSPACAAQYGFASDVVVAAGTTDGCAAFLATGAAAAGEAVTSLGSTLVLKLLCERPLFAPEFGIYSHRIGDVWLAGGASNTGGAALLAFFSTERMAELEAAMRPDVATGLDYYPLPAPGERFPINDPNLAPRVAPRPPDDARFLQGLLEGMAAVEALGYRRLAELGGPPLLSVRTVGGGAGNAAWSRLRARQLGVPLAAPDHLQAACGTARLARRALKSPAA